LERAFAEHKADETLLFATVAIVYLGEVWILSNLQVWLADVRESSYRLEKDAIVTATRARADFGTEVRVFCFA